MDRHDLVRPDIVASVRHDAVRCLLGLLMAVTALASEPATTDGMAALKALQIDHGTIMMLTHDTGPMPGGRPDQVMPRTVIRIRLGPVPGSNITVECCLPDAAAWTGRFIGLGNGGAAGNINSTALIQSAFGGNATATTDMGTAPNAQSGVGNHEVWKDFGYRATHLMTVVGK